jgi:hypothetical protein
MLTLTSFLIFFAALTGATWWAVADESSAK